MHCCAQQQQGLGLCCPLTISARRIDQGTGEGIVMLSLSCCEVKHRTSKNLESNAMSLRKESIRSAVVGAWNNFLAFEHPSFYICTAVAPPGASESHLDSNGQDEGANQCGKVMAQSCEQILRIRICTTDLPVCKKCTSKSPPLSRHLRRA